MEDLLGVKLEGRKGLQGKRGEERDKQASKEEREVAKEKTTFSSPLAFLSPCLASLRPQIQKESLSIVGNSLSSSNEVPEAASNSLLALKSYIYLEALMNRPHFPFPFPLTYDLDLDNNTQKGSPSLYPKIWGLLGV